MTNYVVIKNASLRPDPDDTSPEVIALKINDRVTSLRELKPWTKVSFTAGDGQVFLGWAFLDSLSVSKAMPIDLFDEPGGQAIAVVGEIAATRMKLPPWRKVDVLRPDGSIVTGWISDAGTTGDDVDSLLVTSPVEQHEGAGALDLGPNEVYRAPLLKAEARTGIEATALAALIDAEAAKLPNGQWNKDSKAGTSSAAGLTQFLKLTWLSEASRPQTLLNERSKTLGHITASNVIAAGREDDLLALRFDPEFSIVAAAEYGVFNLDALMKAGLVAEEIGDDEKARFIYIAHHEGLGGAKGFLTGIKMYSFGDLVTQVGEAKAPHLVDAAGGDTTKAYRTWLNGYVDEKIQPSKYRRFQPSGSLSSGTGTGALQSFDGAPRRVADLSADVSLAKAIQWRLSELGYLDPPADGKFGPVSSWALSEFCERNSFSLRDGFTQVIARALVAPKSVLPDIVPSGTWFDKVVAYMKAENYFICRHPDCKNIVYLEGADVGGVPNEDAPNKFNDLRIVFTIGEDGRVVFDGSIWEGTTEPGQFWTMAPMNAKGAARIAFNQFKAWGVGTHHPGSASAHEALVQVEPISVLRDLNKDFKRTGDQPDTGLFAINQHWGYDAPKDDLGRTSAGCLVGRTREGHREFMSLVKSDARYRASRSYRFVTAVMPGDKVLA